MAQRGQRVNELINLLNTREGISQLRQNIQDTEGRTVGIEEARAKARDLVQGLGGDFGIEQPSSKPVKSQSKKEDTRTLKTLTSERSGDTGLLAKLDEVVNRLDNLVRPAVSSAASTTPTGVVGQAVNRSQEPVNLDNPVSRTISDTIKQLQNTLFGQQTQQSGAANEAVNSLSQTLGISPEQVRTGLKRTSGSTNIFQGLAGLGEIKTASGRRLIFNADGSVSEVTG